MVKGKIACLIHGADSVCQTPNKGHLLSWGEPDEPCGKKFCECDAPIVPEAMYKEVKKLAKKYKVDLEQW